jgi:signal transduction histidine kinase
VQLNPHIDGCSISAEPDVFPQYGKYFSVYTVRETDTITTVIEEEYDYFSKIWYKTPRDLNKPCWVAFFDESDSLELTIDGMVASYGRPLYNADKRFVGIVSTDLSLLHLSKLMSVEKPYPNSYFMMIDDQGRYFVHPDSTRLFTQTIFSGADPRRQTDLIALGHEMTAGNQGRMNAVIDGVSCLVCYKPVPGTSWSLAIVCPDSDVLASYHRLTYIVIPLLIIGLFVIVTLCSRAVGQTIHPLNELLDKTQSIAAGNMEVYIPHTQREDVIGNLQNSFATMTEALVEHVDSIRQTTEETKQNNEELVHAMEMAREAVRQKTEFIQNVSHQIRTPLNIIQGFAQVLHSADTLPEEERQDITTTMKYNAVHLNRMVLMLFDSSDSGSEEELRNIRDDKLFCNAIASECISLTETRFPEHTVAFETEVPDSLQIVTSHLLLSRSLLELLYNALKYSDGEHVKLRVTQTEKTVCFTVEDRGIGMPEEWQEKLYKPFVKVNSLSEGLGLGLSLTMRHAIRLGGTLKLDTTYHDGCRFTMEMPK